jgi:hypothetical protein
MDYLALHPFQIEAYRKLLIANSRMLPSEGDWVPTKYYFKGIPIFSDREAKICCTKPMALEERDWTLNCVECGHVYDLTSGKSYWFILGVGYVE